MKITPINGTLDAGGGQKCPPLPYLDVSDNEAIALIRTGVAMPYPGSEELAQAWAESEVAAREEAQSEASEFFAQPPESQGVAAPVELVAVEGPVVAGVALPEPVVPDVVASPALPETGGPVAVAQAAPVNNERRQTISDALELLEPQHLVATGARKGKPKLAAMEDITGIRDLTVAEIDAVFDAKGDE